MNTDSTQTHICLSPQDLQKFEGWLTELKQTWYQTIPVSQFMQISPQTFNRQHFTVTAPMAPNINLHQTMFAGSIYTLMTLTGWGMMWLRQRLLGVEGNIVLADAHIRYHAPINQDPIISVVWPETASLMPLTTGGKAKVKLEVQLHCADKLCATFSGLYFSY
ncbi:thioesterase domain-containing protein [Shewanella goraebulensis]|uniref:thioesterase domain-containing protein n=1 Tax=Shewanella goraebulensis TaxID=3050637 RepID=UPI00254E2E5F|nr:thioesterase domain-containing protein [Shewanella goraebulensis]